MYKERLNQIRSEFDKMSLEEIATELRKYTNNLDMDITIVDKEHSGIFFDEDNNKQYKERYNE